ncbi:MAG: dihydropteroate synthase [Acetivibrio sp.]
MQDEIKIGKHSFLRNGKTYIMGILNVTPDSFSDGGHYTHLEAAMCQVEKMIKEGASIIDVGGESTRPDYTQISIEEEIRRVVPVIRLIKEKYDIAISVDTYKSEVAKAAILAGADLVNDIWGLKYDKKMAGVIQESGASVCLMHNRKNIDYQDFFEDLKSDLWESIEIAREAGIPENRVMIDPGVGFAKSLKMNLICINRLEELHSLGFPILLGTSRKSVIGLTLDLPVTEREEGTLTTTVLAVNKGCQFVRVHSIEENRRAIVMAEAILAAK